MNPNPNNLALSGEPESSGIGRASVPPRVGSPTKGHPLVVAYGGGTNSTAMLCGFRERGIRPALILFADTGGELPHTYEHLRLMSDKCEEWFGLPIETVYKTFKGEFEGLEGHCLRNKALPSLAYGRKGCSVKYKVEPQNKRLRAWMDERAIKSITKAIGYDVNEGHRGHKIKHNDLRNGRTEYDWYPLIEWRWGRPECEDAIRRHGLPQPGKSACFFCPAMKVREIMRLREANPEYYARAVAMEENITVKGRVEGLAFGQKWSEIVKADDDQLKLFDWLDKHDPHHVPCGCYDG
jgi:hypothetical protein